MARKYKTTSGILKRLNNLETNIILPGTILNIRSDNNVTYIVKSNDSIESIAKYFNVNINELKQINHLQTNDILVGQVLLIPQNI